MKNLESVFALLGNPGKYQAFLYILLASNYSYMSFNNLIMAIYGAVNPHHCKLPENVTVENAIPKNEFGDKLDSCRVYVNYSSASNMTMPCQNGYTFLSEPREFNIIMEWELVCDKLYLAKLTTTLYFLGVMIGGVIFGSLSDRYGRKPVLLFTLYVPIVLGIALSFVTHLALFIVLRFIMGVLLQGMQAITCTLLLEISQRRHRSFTGTIMQVMWSVGGMYLAFISYLLQDWHQIQLVISLHSIVTISFIWLVPESIRWLATHRKYEKANTTLQYLAKLNCTTIVQSPFEEEEEEVVKHKIKEKATSVTFHNISAAFKSQEMRKRTFGLYYVWFATSMTYYGLVLNVSTLAGNKYLNFFIMCAVDLPAFLLCMAILGKVGRRRPLCVFLLFGGALCISAAAIPYFIKVVKTAKLVSTVLALLGKFGVAGGFGVLYMYTSELFPTVIRNLGVGSSAFMARLGALIAPQMLLLGHHTFKAIPVFVFGVSALVASGVCLLLPETLHKPMPDSIADVDNMSKKSHVTDQEEDNQHTKTLLNESTGATTNV